jgi:hypothetical protein
VIEVGWVPQQPVFFTRASCWGSVDGKPEDRQGHVGEESMSVIADPPVAHQARAPASGATNARPCR